MKSIFSRSGFTLTEIIVSVAVSGMVIIGITLFMAKIQTDIATTTLRSSVYLDLSRFLEKIHEVRKSYSDTILIDTGTGSYDAIILTNASRTAGVAIGVIDSTPGSPSENKFDAVSNFETYGRKVLGVVPVSGAQITALGGWSSALSTISASPDSLFPGIQVEQFQAVLYNSGVVTEAYIRIREGYIAELKGKNTKLVPTGNPIDYVLNF